MTRQSFPRSCGDRRVGAEPGGSCRPSRRSFTCCGATRAQRSTCAAVHVRTYPARAPHSLCTAQACSKKRRLEDKDQRNHGERTGVWAPPRLQPTGHVHHPAVAVLHDVARLAVDPAGRHAVHVEKAQRLRLALSPRRRQVGQLRGREEMSGLMRSPERMRRMKTSAMSS